MSQIPTLPNPLPEPTTCRKCGTPGLYWVHPAGAQYGDLLNAAGQLHKWACPYKDKSVKELEANRAAYPLKPLGGVLPTAPPAPVANGAAALTAKLDQAMKLLVEVRGAL